MQSHLYCKGVRFISETALKNLFLFHAVESVWTGLWRASVWQGTACRLSAGWACLGRGREEISFADGLRRGWEKAWGGTTHLSDLSAITFPWCVHLNACSQHLPSASWYSIALEPLGSQAECLTTQRTAGPKTSLVCQEGIGGSGLDDACYPRWNNTLAMIISSLRALRAVKLSQVSDLRITTVTLTWFVLFRTFFLQLWVGYSIEINWGDLRHLVVAFAPHTVVTRCNQVCLRQNLWHSALWCGTCQSEMRCSFTLSSFYYQFQLVFGLFGFRDSFRHKWEHLYGAGKKELLIKSTLFIVIPTWGRDNTIRTIHLFHSLDHSPSSKTPINVLYPPHWGLSHILLPLGSKILLEVKFSIAMHNLSQCLHAVQ